jgi:uncharacterized protein (TIGR00299 family) protein
MKHLHFECVGGASGDMILGALIELGVSLEAVKSALAALPLGSFDLIAERGESQHISGLRLRVIVEGHPEAAEPAEPHDHNHNPNPNHNRHPHHHPHRALSDIESMIAAANFSPAVKQWALRAFRSLGEAEAKIHGVPVEHIHFHEVGAADSILDMVGSCWALHQLGVDSISVGPIPFGHGTIHCAHGVYPNPAPATLELLAGMPVTQTDEPFELVTPTGAALLAGWKSAEAIPPGARPVKTAYSLGRRALHHRPNLLRATLYEIASSDPEYDTALLLECNLDDTTPELAGGLMDEVLAAGALDVFCTPVTMKKQRPGILFSVLCEPAQRERLLDVVFRGSTTFGVREYEVRRTKLARRFEKVSTPYGEVHIKIGTWRNEDITRAPEMADCQRLAKLAGVPTRTVYEAASRR